MWMSSIVGLCKGLTKIFWAYVCHLQVGEADMRVIGSLLAIFFKVNTV